MRRSIVATVLLTLFSACAGSEASEPAPEAPEAPEASEPAPEPYQPIALRPWGANLAELGDYQADSARSAIEQINSAVGLPVYTESTLETEHSAYVQFHLNGEGCTLQPSELALATIPADGSRCDVCVSAGFGLTANTIVHELLHCTGLGHDDSSDSVLFWRSTPNGRITTAHIAHLRSLAGR